MQNEQPGNRSEGPTKYECPRVKDEENKKNESVDQVLSKVLREAMIQMDDQEYAANEGNVDSGSEMLRNGRQL